MSSHFSFVANTREITGNRVNTLRRIGLIPAVMYGRGSTPVNLKLDKLAFLKLFKKAGKTSVIELSIDGKATPCIIQDIDINPINDDLRHVDFIIVDLKKKVVTAVPVDFSEVHKLEKEFNVNSNHVIETLDVESLPDNIPQSITLNLDSIKSPSDVLKVSDLVVDGDYVFVSSEDEVILSFSEKVKTVEAETPTAAVPENLIQDQAESNN